MLADSGTGALINIAVEALVIGVRTDVEIGQLADVPINGIDMPVGVFVVVASAVIALEFAVSASYGVDALVEALTGKIVPTSDDGVNMLADVDAIMLPAVMTALKSIVSATLADSVPFC